MNIKSKQRGITFLGLVLYMGLIAFFVATGLTLYPLYYEKFEIISSIETVSNRPDAAKLSPSEVRKYFMRNMAMTNSKRFSPKNIKNHVKVIKGKKGEPNKVRIQYEAENNLYQDLYFVLNVEETRDLGE